MKYNALSLTASILKYKVRIVNHITETFSSTKITGWKSWYIFKIDYYLRFNGEICVFSSFFRFERLCYNIVFLKYVSVRQLSS